jgi:NAD(P)-dependent dehydrogenase (short-subunit alcohol dehydrogenase family)
LGISSSQTRPVPTIANGPVFLLAGHVTWLEEAIVAVLQDTPATVATMDIDSTDIRVRSTARSFDDLSIPGYGLKSARDIDRQVGRAVQLLHRVDALVNVIGFVTDDRATLDYGIDREFQTALAITKAVYSAWMRASGGLVVSVLGVADLAANRAIDTVGEASILALTRELSAELAPAVDVNAVVLGQLDRELQRLLVDAIRNQPDRRDNDIHSVARAVVELQRAPRGSRTGEIVVFPIQPVAW